MKPFRQKVRSMTTYLRTPATEYIKKSSSIVFKSKLFGRTKDICRAVSDEVLTSKDGAQLIVDEIYKRDPLTVVAHTFEVLQKLLSTRRSENMPFCSNALRFNAQLCKSISLGEAAKLSDAIAALYLLENGHADSFRRLYIFSALVSNDTMLSPRLSIKPFVRTVKYKKVGKVLQKCDSCVPAR